MGGKIIWHLFAPYDDLRNCTTCSTDCCTPGGRNPSGYASLLALSRKLSSPSLLQALVSRILPHSGEAKQNSRKASRSVVCTCRLVVKKAVPLSVALCCAPRSSNRLPITPASLPSMSSNGAICCWHCFS